ncbi:hypothetical protein VTK56DRAFT_8423 [Thermocarpiscus australiensis]
MAPARASLRSFLATARKALSAPPAQKLNPLTFVVGNESADLDSICSALLLAYFRTHTPPHTLHIPLCNLPRADLDLRPELNAVLRPAGLQPDDLITLTDLPRDGLDPSDTRWLLVDHNVLSGTLAVAASVPSRDLILGCIDHHEDEGAVPRDLPAGQPRVFARCGSCMSLVLDQCRSTWERLSAGAAEDCEDGTSAARCDAELARVALAPILIDTTNLTSRDKTTEWDVRAVELAESKLRSGMGAAGGYDRTQYFDELTRLKEQLRGLSYRDILRKDYKRWREDSLALGVSTVAQGLEYLLREVGDKEHFLAALRDWAREQALDIAAVMTVSRPGGVFTRELLVWALNENAVGVVKEFVRKYEGTLGLESWRDGELDGSNGEKGEWRACWRQRHLEHSRKQVAPMLREVMRESSRL